MPRRPSQFLQVRGTDTQPVRTMPEQDETGKGDSGPHSGVPIRRQLDAHERTTNPQGIVDAPDELLAMLMQQLRRQDA